MQARNERAVEAATARAALATSAPQCVVAVLTKEKHTFFFFYLMRSQLFFVP